MKATGIIRRIDDLGRIVIPKELRKIVGIHEGDPFEIYLDPVDKMVCFKRYTPMSEHADTLNQLEDWVEEFMYEDRTKARDLIRQLRAVFQKAEREEE